MGLDVCAPAVKLGTTRNTLAPMSNSWLTHRSWQFVADMNGDGAVTIRDVWPWLKWLYFLPGDAVLAVTGPTVVGRFLELTPASLGSPLSAGLSFFLWTISLYLVLKVLGAIFSIIGYVANTPARIKRYFEDREFRKGGRHIGWRGERDRARDEHRAQQQEHHAEAGQHRQRPRWLLPLFIVFVLGWFGLLFLALTG